MPRKPRKPSYSLHKATGLARVRINGHDHYLGAYKSPESFELYDELIADWQRAHDSSGFTVTIDELALRFLKFAEGYYQFPDGTSTGTANYFRMALRPVVQQFGEMRVRDFGPRKLKEVRQRLVERGHCRSGVNLIIRRIRQAFKWGCEEELVPPSILQALAAVGPLRLGRTEAHESEPIMPVSDRMVEQTLPHLPPVVVDMVRFQRLTGCRPSEVCMLRPCDLDRSADVWRFIPERHKTRHHGKKRVIMIGPKAQEILLPYLLRDESNHCFSPRESERKRRELKHQQRKTPLNHGNRPGTNRKTKPKRILSDKYNKDSYARAVSRACEKAFPPPEPLAQQEGESKRRWLERLTDKQKKELKAWRKEHSWSPNQLRHTMSTEVRKDYGLEAAQVVLGHSRADVTQIYAERDLKHAERIAKQIG